MTVISRISSGLFLDDRLTEAELAGSRLCIAAMLTLQHMAEHGGIALTKTEAFKRTFVTWAVEAFRWPNYSQPDREYEASEILSSKAGKHFWSPNSED